ncbi:MAG: DNA repair protein RadC [Cyanobacteria bacterium P01_A01_bin.68]
MDYQSRLRINEMATHERPRERLARHGARALSDSELLALILRSGSHNTDVMALAQQIMARAGSLSGIQRMSENEFCDFDGIGEVKAGQFVAIFEMARRFASERSNELKVIDAPEEAYRYLRSITVGLDVEKFYVLCLNRKNRLIKHVEISSGTATSSLVHPREVFREVIRSGAASVLCAHNHPSGDPIPSRADVQITRRLKEAAKVLDIYLLDHVIIGEVRHDPQGIGFYSFSDNGLI